MEAFEELELFKKKIQLSTCPEPEDYNVNTMLMLLHSGDCPDEYVHPSDAM